MVLKMWIQFQSIIFNIIGKTYDTGSNDFLQREI